MKRRLLALGILGSPLLLAAGCVIAMVLACGLVWLIPDENGSGRVLRIVSLAPLSTLQSGDSQTSSAGAVLINGSNVQPQESESGQAITSVAPGERPSQEQIDQALGFSLPVGSVNSITHEGVATRLVIPRINLDAPVMLSPIENQTWKVDHLGQQYVGHLEGTASPGSNSNIVLAAHVTVSAGVYGPFANLSDLQPGDAIYVYYGDQVFEYTVDDYQTVDRTAVDVTFPTQTGRVTLITCSNWSDSEGRYLERLIVAGSLSGG